MKFPIAIIFLLISSTHAQSTLGEDKEEPSLVEIARRTRLAKESRTTPVPVISNEDLAKFSNATVSVVRSSKRAPDRSPAARRGQEAQPEEENSQVEAQQTPAAEPDMAFWESAFREARLHLQNVVNQGLVLRLRMNNLRNAYFSEDDGTTQSRLQAELQQTLEGIERNAIELEEAKRSLAELQARAKAEGVAAGTIRQFTGEVTELEDILTPMTPTP